MRHLVYACRPCLASIRKQQGQALARRTLSPPVTASFTSRPRIRTLTALHTLRGKSTAAAHTPIDPETTADFDEFARAFEPKPDTRNARSATNSRSKPTAGAHSPIEPNKTSNLGEFGQVFDAEPVTQNASYTERSGSRSAAIAHPPVDRSTTTNFNESARAFVAEPKPRNARLAARHKRLSLIANFRRIDLASTNSEKLGLPIKAGIEARHGRTSMPPGFRRIDLRATKSEKLVRAIEPEIEPEVEARHGRISTGAADRRIYPGSTIVSEKTPSKARNGRPSTGEGYRRIYPISTTNSKTTRSTAKDRRASKGPAYPTPFPTSITDSKNSGRPAEPKVEANTKSSMPVTGPSKADAEWEEIEAALFRQDEDAQFKNGMGTEWEDFCIASANTTKSSHVLSYCWTVEDYFKAIELDATIKLNRDVREAMAKDKWIAWFRQVEKQSGERASDSPWLTLERSLTHRDIESLGEKWQRLSPLARDSRWLRVITQCINTWPTGLPLVLAAIAEQGIARPCVLKDVIRLLGNQIHLHKDPQRFADSVVVSLLSVLGKMDPGTVEVTQLTVYRILKFASMDKLHDLYAGLRKYNCKMSLDTKMQFASRLAKDINHRERSLEVVRDMVQEDNLDINSVEGAALATSLLAIKNESPLKADRTRSAAPPVVSEEVHKFLFGLGLRPNIITLTAIIQALCEIGQVQKAFEVYDLMVELGLEPDEQVFLTLLYGCKTREYYASAERVVGLVKQHNIHSRFIWNEVLHTILLAAMKRKGKGARILPIFPAMGFAYNKLFHPELLQKFLITDLKHHTLEISDKVAPPDWLWPLIKRTWRIVTALPNNWEPMQPGIDTILIMLKGYIQGFGRSISIVKLYAHFRELIKSRDPLVVGFMREAGPQLHNLILKALCSRASRLRFALDIVSNMLKDSIEVRKAAEEAGRNPEEDEQVWLHPAPDIRTWGILHKGFVAHMRYKEADEILEIMNRYGTAPNLKTYNQVLGRYVRRRKPAEALDIMSRIQQAGLVPDAFTKRFATRLHRRLRKHEKTPEIMQLVESMAGGELGGLGAAGPVEANEAEHDNGDNNYADLPADEGRITDYAQQKQAALDEYDQLEAELSQGAVSDISRSSGATGDPSVWQESWTQSKG